jgi:hypothetical protein
MNFRWLRFARLLVVPSLVLVAALPAPAQQPAPRRGRSIEFSEPRSDVVSSNLNLVGTRRHTLSSVEQELKKPFELLNPADDSLSSVLVPPVRRTFPSPARTKRLKEQLEKRDEWMFLEAEDYGGELTPEDMLGVPEYDSNGELKRPRTAFERYYERREKERAAATNELRATGVVGWSEKDRALGESKELGLYGDSSPFGSGITDTERTMKRLSNTDEDSTSTSEAVAPKSFSEFFGFGKTESPNNAQEAARAHQARMEEFKQFLDTRSLSSPTLAPGSPLAPPPSAQFGGLGAFSDKGQPGALSPALSSSSPLSPLPSLPSLPTSPGLPTWQSPPPAPPPPHVTLPQSTFSLPQRKF